MCFPVTICRSYFWYCFGCVSELDLTKAMFFQGYNPYSNRLGSVKTPPESQKTTIFFISLGPTPQWTGQTHIILLVISPVISPSYPYYGCSESRRYPVVITFHHVWGYSQYITTISLMFVGDIFHLLFTPDVCYFNPQDVGVVRRLTSIGYLGEVRARSTDGSLERARGEQGHATGWKDPDFLPFLLS